MYTMPLTRLSASRAIAAEVSFGGEHAAGRRTGYDSYFVNDAIIKLLVWSTQPIATVAYGRLTPVFPAWCTVNRVFLFFVGCFG